MSLTMRVRPNKYRDLKPSDQRHTSGQRRRLRVRKLFAKWHQAEWAGEAVEDPYSVGCYVGHLKGALRTDFSLETEVSDQ